MIILGRIEKPDKNGLWYAECRSVGAFTQGRSRQDAREMLADCIEVLVDREGFKVTATELGEDGSDGYLIGIDATEVGVLLAEVLKHQRRMHGLTLQQVADRLGSKNVNAYAAYERAEREPSVSKYRELLAAVAPEMRLFVAEGATQSKPKKRAAR